MLHLSHANLQPRLQQGPGARVHQEVTETRLMTPYSTIRRCTLRPWPVLPRLAMTSPICWTRLGKLSLHNSPESQQIRTTNRWWYSGRVFPIQANVLVSNPRPRKTSDCLNVLVTRRYDWGCTWSKSTVLSSHKRRLELLFRHSATNSIAQQEYLATFCYRCYLYTVNGGCSSRPSSSLSLSVGFSIQDEAIDGSRSAPQRTCYHAGVIDLLP